MIVYCTCGHFPHYGERCSACRCRRVRHERRRTAAYRHVRRHLCPMLGHAPVLNDVVGFVCRWCAYIVPYDDWPKDRA